MIAKSEWFTRRKYTGWGLTPKTWQGWIYILIAVALSYFLSQLPVEQPFKITVLALLILFLLIDLLQVMSGIKMDEREVKTEALAERNASWSMVAVVAIEVVYISVNQAVFTWYQVLQFLISVLVVGVVVKGLSNFILDRRGL